MKGRHLFVLECTLNSRCIINEATEFIPDGLGINSYRWMSSTSFPKQLQVFFGNKSLTNHNIATTKVSAWCSCEIKCYHDPNCVSINFNVTPDSRGLQECKLSNATYRSHKRELKKKKIRLCVQRSRGEKLECYFSNFVWVRIWRFSSDLCFSGIRSYGDSCSYRPSYDHFHLRWIVMIKLGFAFEFDTVVFLFGFVFVSNFCSS